MENILSVTGHCAGNSPVPDKFPAQRPVTRSFDVFFDLRLNKRLSKQSRDWWFETPSRSLWRHRNAKAKRKQLCADNNQYGPVTVIVPASGHQVRCIPWVQMGTLNKEIGFLCGLKFFTLNIFCGEYLQSSLHLMLQKWWKPLQWKMYQWIMMRF